MIDWMRRYFAGRDKIDLSTGFDPNDVKEALDIQLRTITGKVPPEVMAKVLKIRQTILGILPRSGNLPRANATRHPGQDSKTPKEVLLDQLTLLETKMNEVADDVHRNDWDRLLAHGRFLEERFGRGPGPRPDPARNVS